MHPKAGQSRRGTVLKFAGAKYKYLGISFVRNPFVSKLAFYFRNFFKEITL